MSTVREPCPWCNGNGKNPCTACNGMGTVTCTWCSGTGKARRLSLGTWPVGTEEKDCVHCRGLGKTDCTFCHGQGYKQCSVCAGSGYWERISPGLGSQSSSVFGHFNISSGRAAAGLCPRAHAPAASAANSCSSVLDFLVASGALLVFCALVAFGPERFLVAAEGFFLFAGWAALRAAGFLREQQSQMLEKVRVVAATGFGLCAGFLSAYLILTTPEGQALTDWVTAQTVRMIGSLMAFVLGLGLLEVVWGAMSGWLRRRLIP